MVSEHERATLRGVKRAVRQGNARLLGNILHNNTTAAFPVVDRYEPRDLVRCAVQGDDSPLFELLLARGVRVGEVPLCRLFRAIISLPAPEAAANWVRRLCACGCPLGADADYRPLLLEWRKQYNIGITRTTHVFLTPDPETGQRRPLHVRLDTEAQDQVMVATMGALLESGHYCWESPGDPEARRWLFLAYTHALGLGEQRVRRGLVALLERFDPLLGGRHALWDDGLFDTRMLLPPDGAAGGEPISYLVKRRGYKLRPEDHETLLVCAVARNRSATLQWLLSNPPPELGGDGKEAGPAPPPDGPALLRRCVATDTWQCRGTEALQYLLGAREFSHAELCDAVYGTHVRSVIMLLLRHPELQRRPPTMSSGWLYSALLRGADMTVEQELLRMGVPPGFTADDWETHGRTVDQLVRCGDEQGLRLLRRAGRSLLHTTPLDVPHLLCTATTNAHGGIVGLLLDEGALEMCAANGSVKTPSDPTMQSLCEEINRNAFPLQRRPVLGHQESPASGEVARRMRLAGWPTAGCAVLTSRARTLYSSVWPTPDKLRTRAAGDELCSPHDPPWHPTTHRLWPRRSRETMRAVLRCANRGRDDERAAAADAAAGSTLARLPAELLDMLLAHVAHAEICAARERVLHGVKGRERALEQERAAERARRETAMRRYQEQEQERERLRVAQREEMARRQQRRETKEALSCEARALEQLSVAELASPEGRRRYEAWTQAVAALHAPGTEEGARFEKLRRAAAAQAAAAPAASTPSGMPDQCAHCSRRTRPDGRPLLLCSRCQEVRFCSQECQRRAWRLHKRACRPPP